MSGSNLQKVESSESGNLLDIFTITKLTPYQVINLPDGQTIYDFWRVDSKKPVSFRKKGVRRENAMITVSKDKKSFNLSYASINDGVQNLQDLPLDKLAEVCQSLKEAGFK